MNSGLWTIWNGNGMYMTRGDARQVALDLGIGRQPLLGVLLLLLGRPGLVGNLAALHHRLARRHRPDRAQRHHGPGARGMGLEVPVGRADGLPDAVQIRPAVTGAGQLRLPFGSDGRQHPRQQPGKRAPGEQQHHASDQSSHRSISPSRARLPFRRPGRRPRPLWRRAFNAAGGIRTSRAGPAPRPRGPAARCAPRTRRRPAAPATGRAGTAPPRGGPRPPARTRRAHGAGRRSRPRTPYRGGPGPRPTRDSAARAGTRRRRPAPAASSQPPCVDSARKFSRT